MCMYYILLPSSSPWQPATGRDYPQLTASGTISDGDVSLTRLIKPFKTGRDSLLVKQTPPWKEGGDRG